MEKLIENKSNWKAIGMQALILLAFVLLPLVLTNRFYLRLITEIIIYGLLAMSLDVLLGFTGLLSFMHAAYMGIGAYSVAIFLTYVDPAASIWITFPLAIFVTVILAFLAGWLQVRTGGFAFALLTVAFGMMYYTVVWKARSITCGDDGLCGLPKPDISIGPLVLGNMNDNTTAYFFTLTVAAACYFITRPDHALPVRGRFGIDPGEHGAGEFHRHKRQKLQADGLDARLYPGGRLGGPFHLPEGVRLADPHGCPRGRDRSHDDPSRRHGDSLGGPSSERPAYIFLQDFISAMTENWMVFLGLAVILLTLFMPKGLAALPRESDAKSRQVEDRHMNTILETSGLCRHFGGVRAVNDVTIDIQDRKVKAVIGPNGAGKTTLFNTITGRLPATAGSVSFHGRDITRMPVFERVRLGICRTFQINSLFLGSTVFENVRIAKQTRMGKSLKIFARKESLSEVNEATFEILDRVGLTDKASEPAKTLSYGDQRALEVGIALAGEPKILLLDEPTAGMSQLETNRIIKLIQKLVKEIAVVLVEHDVDMVLSISDSISVMHQGSIIGEGTPDEICRNQRVREAYLGDENGH